MAKRKRKLVTAKTKPVSTETNAGYPGHNQCCWPMWVDNCPPKQRQYCCKPILTGSSYCLNHHKISYSRNNWYTTQSVD